MAASTYTTIALGMRYFFTAAILYILLRLVWQSVNEFKEVQRVKSQVAGTYWRYIIFTAPAELHGVKYALEKEAVIGRAAKCNIRLDYKGIRRRHANLYLSGSSTWLCVYKKRGACHNGQPITQRNTELCSGDTVELCGICFTYMQRTAAEKAEENHA